jgi:hypothetical protein
MFNSPYKVVFHSSESGILGVIRCSLRNDSIPGVPFFVGDEHPFNSYRLGLHYPVGFDPSPRRSSMGWSGLNGTKGHRAPRRPEVARRNDGGENLVIAAMVY